MYALHDPRISRDSQVSNIFFYKKKAWWQVTFNSIVIMATLSGASENGTRNYVHYSNDSKKIILLVLKDSRLSFFLGAKNQPNGHTALKQ